MRAKLGMPPAKLGLIYGHTGFRSSSMWSVWLAPRELFLTGRNLSAPRAMAIGLVHDTVLDEELGPPPPSNWPRRWPPTPPCP